MWGALHTRSMQLSDLASALGCELRGDGALEISGVAGMEHASPSELTFLANPKYAHKLKDTRAGAVLLSQPVDGLAATQLISTNPYLDFSRALALFYQPPRPALGIHPLASIDPSARIDSLVQIGHGCVVGEDNIICAQTGLAGSSVLEKNVLLAGQVGISGHLTIHDNAVIYAQSGIGGDVAAGAVMSGSPAFEAREWLRAITAFPKLPEILKR